MQIFKLLIVANQTSVQPVEYQRTSFLRFFFLKTKSDKVPKISSHHMHIHTFNPTDSHLVIFKPTNLIEISTAQFTYKK